MTVDESAVLAGLSLMQRHNINTTDAALQAALLRHAGMFHPEAATHVLVAADKRLLRAVGAEGLQTLNPEDTSVADVPSLLAGW